MTLNEYLKSQFQKDLKKLNFRRPNDIMLKNAESFRIDEGTIYFGGRGWSNLKQDIQDIEQRDYFFLCLFSITVIDLTFFTYFHTSYKKFREKTMYPKFGWTGFGSHYENPKQLLAIPEKEGLLNHCNLKKELDEYIKMFIYECDSFLKRNTPELNSIDFLAKMINDKELIVDDSDKGTFYEILYTRLRKEVQELEAG